MSENDIDWVKAYGIINSPDFDCEAFLHGYDFYDAAVERYQRDGIVSSFSDYIWTLRSMFLPLLTIMGKDIPRADIYHAVSAGYAGVIGALGSLLYNKPFILSEHGIYTREREEELIRSKWTRGFFKEMWIQHFYMLSQFAYNQASSVVSLFDKNAAIQQELGCPPEKIVVIPNGVDAAQYGDINWRRQNDGYVNIGAVIRFSPIKDVKTMITAFAETKKRVKNARFYLMGPYDEDPEYYQECMNMISQLGLEDIEVPGRVNVREYLPLMDIMVLTSISEGQPLAILEGMLMHKPWVATNVGNCQELLYGKSNDPAKRAGIIAAVMDPKGIADAIVKLAGDERLRLDMGEAGYRRASKYYRLEDMYEGYKILYENYRGK